MTEEKRDTAGRLVDRLRGAATARDTVDVWVSREEILPAIGLGADAGGVPARPFARAVAAMVAAVRQPLRDERFEKTGAVASGAEGAGALAAHWGNAPYRRLSFSRDALVAAVTAHPKGVELLAAIVETSRRRAPFMTPKRMEQARQSRAI